MLRQSLWNKLHSNGPHIWILSYDERNVQSITTLGCLHIIDDGDADIISNIWSLNRALGGVFQ